MITLKLWQALRNPRCGDHPLYKRLLLEKRPSVRMPIRVMVGGSIIAGMVLMCLLTYVVPVTMVPQLAFIPVVMPFLYLLIIFGGTGRAMILTGKITPVIIHEHEKETFETLSTTPEGALGVYWVIINAMIYREHNLEDTNRFHVSVTLLAFWGVTILLLIFYLNAWTDMALEAFLRLPFVLYPLVALYYVDAICSLVMGVLLAAVTAAFVPRRTEGQIAAVALFIMLQAVIYALVVWLTLFMTPALFRWLNFSGIYASMSLAGLSVVIYYAVRETVNSGLWLLLSRRLDATLMEREMVSAP